MRNESKNITISPDAGCGCAAIILAIVIAWNFWAILDCIDRKYEHEALRARIEALEKRGITAQEIGYLDGISFPDIKEATEEGERQW